jgi:hypothetical protein
MKKRPLAILAGLVLCGCAPGPDAGFERPEKLDHYTGGLVVSPSPVAFAETVAGCTGSVDLELRNESDVRITIEDMTAADEAFLLSRLPPIELEAGGSRSVTLHFAPDRPGRRSATVAFATDEAQHHPYELPVAASAVPPPPEVAAAATTPLDMVLVVDVSTTMSQTADLREALQALFERVEAGGLDARFGLVTFENDVLVHGGGAFLDREGFFQELDSQLVEGEWVPDGDLPRQLLNFDFAENVLDALYRSATDFSFRPGARHYLLLLTDDTFREPPEVFSDGTPASHGYGEVAAALEQADVRLFSVHAPISGRGLSSGHDGRPSLVEATGGAWFPIDAVDSGTLDLGALLADLLTGPTCR